LSYSILQRNQDGYYESFLYFNGWYKYHWITHHIDIVRAY
jgi:hypothetical protein